MSAHVAAYAATGLSILSMVLCFMFIPTLWTIGSNIEQQVRVGMEEFRLLESEVWSEVVSARREQTPHSRKARQAPQCRTFGSILPSNAKTT